MNSLPRLFCQRRATSPTMHRGQEHSDLGKQLPGWGWMPVDRHLCGMALPASSVVQKGWGCRRPLAKAMGTLPAPHTSHSQHLLV